MSKELSQNSYQIVSAPRVEPADNPPPSPGNTPPHDTPPPSPHGSWYLAFADDLQQLPEWTSSSGVNIGSSGSSPLPVYHMSTRLLGEHEGILIDLGSIGNLAKEKLVRSVATLA